MAPKTVVRRPINVRIADCETKSRALSGVSGAWVTQCAKCNAPFWRHPKGVVKLCCGCREAKRLAYYQRWSGARVTRAGYPRTEQFATSAELAAYFANERLTCLICGGEYRALPRHIARMHETSVDQYKERFGIPYSLGLVGSETKELMSENAYQIIADKVPEWDEARTRAMIASPLKVSGRAAVAPALLTIQRGLAKKASDAAKHSPKRVSLLAKNKVAGICSICGGKIIVSELAAITNACKLLCGNCRRQRASVAGKRYRASPQGIAAKPSPERRLGYLKRMAHKIAPSGVCFQCSATFAPSYTQALRIQNKLPVFCSISCAGKHGMRVRWGTKRRNSEDR